MDLKPEFPVEETIELADPQPLKPLEILYETERSLRLRTVDTLVPLLSEPLVERVQQASELANVQLEELSEIDLEQITDQELQPARIQVGLALVGFGALMMVFLLLYLGTLHPELDPVERVKAYWYPYIWFVCLGVAGLFMLGREAMRPPFDS